MKKELCISVLAASMLALSGCGSSDSADDGTSGKTSKTLKAQFIDSPVQGVDYDCKSSGNKGVTDANGYFSYVAGDTCTFSVGAVELGSAKPSGSVVTPRNLTDKPAEVTNILRLLQTLDTDAKPENGITLPEGIAGSVDLGDNFEAEISGFISTNEDEGTVTSGTVVVSAEDAEAHFETSTTLALSDATFAGKTFTFSSTTKQVISFNTDKTATKGATTLTWSVVDGTLHVGEMVITLYIDATTKVVDPTGTTTGTYTAKTTPVAVEDPDTDPVVDTTDSPIKKVLIDLGATVDPTATAKSIMTKGLFSTGVSIRTNSGYTDMFSQRLDASNKLVQYNYDQKSGTFIAREDDKQEDYDVTLTDGVWIKTTQNQSLTFNSNGDFVVSNPTLGKITLKIDALNISGLSIADINNSTSSPFIDTDKPVTDIPNFSEGAKAYSFSIPSSLFKPYYKINTDYHQSCSWNDITGEEECTEEYGDTIEGYNSISQLIADYTLNSDSNYSLTMNDYVNRKAVNVLFSGSNTLIITDMDNYIYDGSTGSTAASTTVYPNGSYEVKTVGSTQILILTLPEMLVDEHKKNETLIYSMYDGKLSRGSYVFAEDEASTNSVWFNETAAHDIYNFGQSFTPEEVHSEDTNTSTELMPDLIGAWNNTSAHTTQNEYGVDETITRTSNITVTATTISDTIVTDSVEKHEVYSAVSSYQVTGTNTLSDSTVVTKLAETYTQYNASITLKTEAAVNYYNQNTKCGISDWSINTPHNCNSYYNAFIGISNKDIITLSGDQLIFGNFGTKDANGYPTELNTAFSYTQTVN